MGKGTRVASLLVTAVAAAAGLAATPAGALAPPSPWTGHNPFHCRIQNAGTGSTVPHPGADPLCVRYDKTHQNLTQLGLLRFLLLEPARVALAVPKCSYFQEDHWRGSLVQNDGRTVLYDFVGHYFFDKASGDGGVWVKHFTAAGHTFDPRTLPGFPRQYDKYFGPGTGGAITHDAVAADPSCPGSGGLLHVL